MEPIAPAEGEGAADQPPMPADRPVLADQIICLARLALALPVDLLHPLPQPVPPDDLRNVGQRPQEFGGDGQGCRIGRGDDDPGGLRWAGGAVDQVSRPPGLGVPVPERPLDLGPVAGLVRVGPGQFPGGFLRGMSLVDQGLDCPGRVHAQYVGQADPAERRLELPIRAGDAISRP